MTDVAAQLPAPLPTPAKAAALASLARCDGATFELYRTHRRAGLGDALHPHVLRHTMHCWHELEPIPAGKLRSRSIIDEPGVAQPTHACFNDPCTDYVRRCVT